MAAKLTPEEVERRRQMKAAAALDRSPQGLSVVSAEEEMRLYEASMAGVEEPIRVWPFRGDGEERQAGDLAGRSDSPAPT